MITLYIGNHGDNIHTQDLLEYIHDGLREIGETPKFSFEHVVEDGINVTLECFNPTLTDNIIAFQRRNLKSKLFVILSEALSGSTFDTAGTIQKSNGQANNQYDNVAYWETRYQCFTKIVNVTSGLISLSESCRDDYATAFGVPVFYLPMSALPSYVPVRHVYKDKKDIDIYFSGTLTPYRTKIINQFKSIGLNVFIGHPNMPDYLRRHMLGRSKLAIGLKLDESTKYLSTCRAHYYLTRQCPHLFEAVPDITNLHPYLSFSTHSDFVAASSISLASGYAFDNDKLESFKSDFPHEDVFSSLNAFFKNCPIRR